MAIDPNTVVSVVMPLRNDADILKPALEELSAVLAGAFRFYEIILVDDGSTDGTEGLVAGLLKEVEKTRYLRLSRAFGRDVAISAGLESAIGDYVAVMDPNDDPASLVPELVEKCRREGGLMHGLEEKPESRGWLRDMAGAWFRGYATRHLGVTLHRGSTDFRVLSRQAVNSLLLVPGHGRYLRVFMASLGYRQITFPYAPINRRGRRDGARASDEIATAIDILTLHTRHPLRVASLLGLGAAGLNLLYMGYVVAIYFLKDKVAEGWVTTSLQLSGMFFFLFLLLAVLSEYVGSMLGMGRGQPTYFVAEEKNSSVLLEDSVKSSVIRDDGKG